MKRSPLKRKTPLRARRHEPAVEREEKPRAFVLPTVKPLRQGVISRVTSAAAAMPKDRPIRSVAYRRLVAALPCACGCGRQPCQAAHPNTGKGMGTKTDDRLCFPLAPPCHAAFDQGAMFPKAARRQWEVRWGEQTRAAILAAGQWPASLPKWPEKQP